MKEAEKRGRFVAVNVVNVWRPGFPVLEVLWFIYSAQQLLC